MVEDEGGRSGRRLKQLYELLQPGLNEDYRRASMRLSKAREIFHEEVANQIAGPLNSYLSFQPAGTRLQKQDLSRWLNAELRTLGIAIRCPRTGQPAFLRGGPGHKEDQSRFQICLIASPQLGRTVTIADLPSLSFMGNPMRGFKVTTGREP